VKVVSVDNLKNPYEKQENFNMRFKLTLNKLYAWSLVSYERVVMLDSDNIFLQNTDELFQCGRFCAVFINPCIFHTGLFVLKVGLLVLQAFCFSAKLLNSCKSENRLFLSLGVVRNKPTSHLVAFFDVHYSVVEI
jgi:hypothetical protein